MHIAIQGIPGCYHHLAAKKYFGSNLEVISCMTFRDLTDTVANNERCDGGIMAIENSIAGTILNNYHLLMESGLKIDGEIAIRIEHHLLALPGQEIKDIKEVHSHPMAIRQCTQFLSTLDAIKIVEAEDTAGSARNISIGQLKNTAAIASEICTALYGMNSLQGNIETNSNNYTRFLILKKQLPKKPHPTRNKCSVYFNVNDTPGSLLSILQILNTQGINLSKLQSFPVVGKRWQYYFFADLVFPPEVDQIAVFDAIRKVTHSLEVMGVYENKM